jgi:hypothetical protein
VQQAPEKLVFLRSVFVVLKFVVLVLGRSRFVGGLAGLTGWVAGGRDELAGNTELVSMGLLL